MAFLFTEPVIIVPILLFILILIILITIVVVALKMGRARRRKMGANIRRMKELSAAVSNLNLREQEKVAQYNRDLLDYTPKKAEKQKEEAKAKPAKKESGDKTIYDDRKNLSTWQVHLSKTYRDMKKKNPKATFQAAMKAAKKTYKKKK